MQNPILQSEGFERAAYNLSHSLDNFRAGELTECVRVFEQSVSRMARVYGMQAENEQRKHLGQAMAYTEWDFQNA